MINIVCFGNPLCADDGAGHAVFQQLQSELKITPELEPHIQLFYGGNSGQRALPYFMNCTNVIVVDALLDRTAHSPGRIYCLGEEDLSIIDAEEESSGYSSHILALPQSWRLLKELKNPLPELTLFAIEIADTTLYKEGLSQAVASATGKVTKKIMQHCHELMLSEERLC
jgi:hydrogenase maturation protease